MWFLVSILFGLVSCFFIILALGLARAGRRADEGEEKILGIISAPSRKGKEKEIEARTTATAV